MCRAIWPSSNGASIAAPVSPTCSISFLPQPSRPRRDSTPPLLRRTQLGNQEQVRRSGAEIWLKCAEAEHAEMNGAPPVAAGFLEREIAQLRRWAGVRPEK